jgi:hypothetical protein
VPHISNHGVAYIFADAATFFTCDNLAAGYGSDVTLAPNGLRATECMTRASSEPNVGAKVFSTNDCEDHTATIGSLFKGYVEAHETRQKDPAAFDKALASPAFDLLDAEDKENLKLILERGYDMLEPFRQGLANPDRDMIVGDDVYGDKDRMDFTNVLGVALGASAGNPLGVFGGHSYAQLSFLPARRAAAVAAPAPGSGPVPATCPHTGTEIGRAPECLVLEGTAHVKNLDVSARRSLVPIVRKVPPDLVPPLVEQGCRVLGVAPDGLVVLEDDELITDLLAGLEGGLKWLGVADGPAGRRTIPWITLARRGARSHGAGFVGGEQEDALQRLTAEAIERKARTIFYQVRAPRPAPPACPPP